MDEQLLIQEFINNEISLTQLATKYKMRIKKVSEIFKKHGYIIGRSSNRNCILHLKDAIADYKTGSFSITKLAKKYNLSASTISNALKSLGIEVVNKQNALKFNENVFEIIDDEEKAY